MRDNKILITGLRLLVILELLYKNDTVKKNDIFKKLNEIYPSKTFSQETIKLDINTLIKMGYKIEKLNNGRSFCYKLLDKNIVMFNFSKDDISLFEAIKNASWLYLNFEEISFLRKIYARLLDYTNENLENKMCDFGFFNFLNENTIYMLKEAIEAKAMCTVLYNSSRFKKAEINILPIKILNRKEKIYVNIFCENYPDLTTLRLDKIETIRFSPKKINEKFLDINEEVYNYEVKKTSKKLFPLRQFESIKKENENSYLIEARGEYEFFVIQRLLELGLDCKKIIDKELKNKILTMLKNISGRYA